MIMRKLPVYILIDSSYSMRGKPIEYVNNGFSMLMKSLRRDPLLLEILYLSVIEFNTSARQILPLTKVMDCNIPLIEAKGRSNLGQALKLLSDRMNFEIILSDRDKGIRGDYKPVVYMLTDGGSTDAWKKVFKELRHDLNPEIISFGTGNFHKDVLEELSGHKNVIDLREFDKGIPLFFELVSQSISIFSKPAEEADEKSNNHNIKELMAKLYSKNDDLFF